MNVVNLSLMIRFDLVTIDVPEPNEAALFWAAVLNLVELEREDVDRWIVIGEHGGHRRIGFQRGEVRPGGIHLDFVCESHEFAATVERLRHLGAAMARPVRNEPYGSIANMVDPFGYAFDVNSYNGPH